MVLNVFVVWDSARTHNRNARGILYCLKPELIQMVGRQLPILAASHLQSSASHLPVISK
jgi:hypothetical protein